MLLRGHRETLLSYLQPRCCCSLSSEKALGVVISNEELAYLRQQTEFNALAENKAAGEWRKLADALTELEERRAKEQQETT